MMKDERRSGGAAGIFHSSFIIPHSAFDDYMSDFQFAAKAADLPEGGKLLVEIDGQMVALFRVEGRFYALDDVCTHDGGPLAEGELCGFAIACPRHGAKFDIRDGRALTMPATKPTAAHEVRVEGDRVLVRLKN
jgi:3-phenylpropionate/trans-cinnamate dioxygenase ferredoxin subunit